MSPSLHSSVIFLSVAGSINSVLGFRTRYTLKKGIEEIISEINKKTFNFEIKNKYGNYNLNL